MPAKMKLWKNCSELLSINTVFSNRVVWKHSNGVLRREELFDSYEPRPVQSLTRGHNHINCHHLAIFPADIHKTFAPWLFCAFSEKIEGQRFVHTTIRAEFDYLIFADRSLGLTVSKRQQSSVPSPYDLGVSGLNISKQESHLIGSAIRAEKKNILLSKSS